MNKILLALFVATFTCTVNAASILIPMDETQSNHLKAYGVAWHVLEHKTDVKWLLNYRGGSYLFDYSKEDEAYCLERGVKFETLPDVMAKSILDEVNSGLNNTTAVDMQRAPKLAVYAPANKEVWDDAVMDALTYAEIPFVVLYDKEILSGDLTQYDWLHLHHEDFTGQHGRFGLGFPNALWYKEEVNADSICAAQMGYAKVADLKLAVAKVMKNFVSRGGYMFAMCSATETFDIALAADGVDITSFTIDGDPYDPEYAAKLNFKQCLAFENFKLDMSGYSQSNIDTYNWRVQRGVTERNDEFALSYYSVLTHRTEAMLIQNHKTSVHGFWGATAGFDVQCIKKDVEILGMMSFAREARYIHGNLGEGMWTFYSGHDPEDYQHRVEEPKTDLANFPNSPGYRLILNNVLFQSTRTKEETHVAFSAYPSPAVNTLNVNYALNESQSGVLNIYDATGKRMYSQELSAGTSSTIADVSDFSNGTYFWKIESGREVLHSDKFTVAH